VQLVPQGFPSGSTAVQRGLNQWNASTCNSDGTAFPLFQLSNGADRVITVQYNNGAAPNYTVCGTFIGSTITGNSIDYRGTYVSRTGSQETYWDMYGVTFVMY
jgi:hypothetical protein